MGQVNDLNVTLIETQFILEGQDFKELAHLNKRDSDFIWGLIKLDLKFRSNREKLIIV
jgi:hypothetical protein